MRTRLEEEPEPIEVPDDPDEPEIEPEPVASGGPALIPSVPGPAERDYEYRVEVITLQQVVDGKTLPDLLTKASHDDWHLVEIVDAGEKKALLLRKRKEAKPDRRPVGFSVGKR